MKDNYHVIGLNASPRFRDNPGAQQESTTRLLLEYSLNYAMEEKNAQVLLIDLHKLNIKECNGCYSTDENLCNPCLEKGFENVEAVYNGCKCFDDDYKLVEQEILKADAVIFASPVNNGLPNPRMLNVFNRMTALEYCVRKDGKLLDSPLVGKVAGAIATGIHTGAYQVAQQMLNIANDFGFLIPPFPCIDLQGSISFHTVLNKELLNDAVVAHNLEVMADNVCEMIRIANNAGWNTDYLENMHPLSKDEAEGKFDYKKELGRYVKENWDELIVVKAKGKKVNPNQKIRVPTLP